jgi:hypothetical protein
MHPSPSISPAAYWGDSFSGLFVGTRSNGDDPVTEVRGTEGCCWNTVPDSIEAERGQVPENRAPEASDRLIWGRRHAENVGDILDEAIARSKLANDPAHLVPQNGLGVTEPLALPGGADPAAGEPAGDEIDPAGRLSAN